MEGHTVMRQAQGNTLSEYGLMFGMVVAVSVGALSLLGNHTSTLLKSTDTPRNHIMLQRMSNLDFSSGGGAGGNSSSGAPAGLSDTMIANTPGTSKNATGSEGNLIGDVAKTLDSIVAQIQSDPNHDPGLLALVTDLANNGHTTGSALEQTLKSYTTSQQSQDAYNQFNSAYTSFYMDRAHFSQSMDKLNTYLAQHPQVLSDDLQQQIQSAYNSANQLSNAIVGADQLNTDNFDKLVADPHGSTLGIHQDANTVCQSGGDESVCVKPL